MSTKELLVPIQAHSEKDAQDVLYAKRMRITLNQNLEDKNSVFKKVIISLLITNILLVSSLIYQSNKSVMVPWVVEKDPNGNAVAIGMAKQTNYIPQEKEKQYFIERFIRDSRNITFDSVKAKEQFTAAFALTTQATRNKLGEEIRKENIAGRIGQETTQLQMISNVQQSPDTYQVRWTEEVFNHDGTLKEKYNMVGSFTVEVNGVKDENQWRLNPLGIYIKNFSWARELR